jgi:hypothetical protein
MAKLTAAQLIEVWEIGAGKPPAERALALLAAAYPYDAPEALAQLSIGRRDARLLSLREATFGSELFSISECPGCGERLEMSFQTGDVRSQPEENGGQEYQLDENGYGVRFRLPNSLDLLAAHGSDAITGRSVLLERCILTAAGQGEDLPIEKLPAAVLTKVIEQMSANDPQAVIELDLACPACGRSWIAPFDILSYFWSEIEAWVQRILLEIHQIATAYGWSEAEILNLSAWRRQRYLELIS